MSDVVTRQVDDSPLRTGDGGETGLLMEKDPVVGALLEEEVRRQQRVLSMVAAASATDATVRMCEGSAAINVTTEGYPGARFHGGSEVVDQLETLAIERAKRAFGARYANVQPHSGTSANAAVICSLLDPGDPLLGMKLDCGGHLSHGNKASIIGQYFDAYGYGVDAEGLIDFDEVRRVALDTSPKLIICGASGYPRTIEFARFRRIADEVGAYLLADISHISGLVVAGEHPSPIDVAHVTTTSTYKQLFGPRGGLILTGKGVDSCSPRGQTPLAEVFQRAVFPFFQSTPNMGAIAAKARALAIVKTPWFAALAARIVADARALAGALANSGYEIVTGGTDNHMVVVDLSATGITGAVAERALEACDIIVNRNTIPGDPRPARVASGIRLGTNTLAYRGMSADDMLACADLIDRCLGAVTVVGEVELEFPDRIRNEIRAAVADLTDRFPLPDSCPEIPS